MNTSNLSRDANEAYAQAAKDSAPFVPSPAQVEAAQMPLIERMRSMTRDDVRAYVGKIRAGTQAAAVFARFMGRA